MYQLLTDSPNVQHLKEHKYSEEEYDDYKLVHKELLKQLLENCP